MRSVIRTPPKRRDSALACATLMRRSPTKMSIAITSSRPAAPAAVAVASTALPTPRGYCMSSVTVLRPRMMVGIGPATGKKTTATTSTAAAASSSSSDDPNASTPSARAADTVTRFYSAWNAADPDGAVLEMADDVEYWDTIYEEPFVGKENVREYFAKAARVLGPAVKFVVDGLSPAEDGSAVGVKWHCELDDGTPLPNSRGCSFYELRDSGKVIFRARDFVEPAVKPGAATLYLLRAVLPLVRLAAKFDVAEKKKDKDGGGGGGGGGSGGGSGEGGGNGGASTSSGGDGGNPLAFALAFAGGSGLSPSSSSDSSSSLENNLVLTSLLSFFGGGKESSSGSSSGSSSSDNNSSSSSSSSAPPPPGSLTVNSALVWLFYVAYFSFVFFSRELPGLPVLETPPEVLSEVAHESWTFYYFVPIFNLIADAVPAVFPPGFRIPDLPEHPASEALFNFVNAWSMMMLPVMLSEASQALPLPSKGGGGDENESEKSSSSSSSSSSKSAFKWWLGVQFLTNVFMIPYMALRAREGGPGNDLVPRAWKKEEEEGERARGRRSTSTSDDDDEEEEKNTSFPPWTPAIGLAGASIGVLSVLWALFARPEVAAELGKGLSEGNPGESFQGRWAWAAGALATNRATWAFALDAGLYSVWQAAMLKEAKPLERFVPFLGMAAYLMRVGDGGGVREKES